MVNFCFLGTALVSSFLMMESRMSKASEYLKWNKNYDVIKKWLYQIDYLSRASYFMALRRFTRKLSGNSWFNLAKQEFAISMSWQSSAAINTCSRTSQPSSPSLLKCLDSICCQSSTMSSLCRQFSSLHVRNTSRTSVKRRYLRRWPFYNAKIRMHTARCAIVNIPSQFL